MKRFCILLTALVLFSVCFLCLNVPVLAGDVKNGEVLYHQDFSVLSEIEKSGIVRGTSSSESAQITCTGDVLELNTYDNDRVYAILPAAAAVDSYTIEFDFSFAEIRSENGYVGFLLTCRGTEPTNVTALVIRADGTIDEFDEPDAVLKKAIADGGTIHVKIPVEKDVLHKIELTADGKTYVLERDNVKVLDDGGRGFVVRNACIRIGGIYLVNGVGYTKKTGTYACASYAADETVPKTDTVMCPEAVTGIPETDMGTAVDTLAETPVCSPETGETIVPYAAFFAAAAMGLFRRKKRRI